MLIFGRQLFKECKMEKESVNHPQHYGGEENPYEAIKVIDAWGLGFNLGNTAKYISRAGKKDPKKEIEDLEKARVYLTFEIEKRKRILLEYEKNPPLPATHNENQDSKWYIHRERVKSVVDGLQGISSDLNEIIKREFYGKEK